MFSYVKRLIVKLMNIKISEKEKCFSYPLPPTSFPLRLRLNDNASILTELHKGAVALPLDN